MDVNTQIGLRLKRARKNACFSQELVAKKLGVNQDTISRLERGATAISAEQLLTFSKFYGKPITFFYLD